MAIGLGASSAPALAGGLSVRLNLGLPLPPLPPLPVLVAPPVFVPPPVGVVGCGPAVYVGGGYRGYRYWGERHERFDHRRDGRYEDHFRRDRH